MAEHLSLLSRIEIDVLGEPMRLYRIVGDPESDQPADSFRSHYELGRLPRGPENRAAAIHMALSMFDRREVAAALAKRVPKLGGHVATMELVPGMGFCVAKTAGPSHWSVWGRPVQLLACIADVEIVGA